MSVRDTFRKMSPGTRVLIPALAFVALWLMLTGDFLLGLCTGVIAWLTFIQEEASQKAESWQRTAVAAQAEARARGHALEWLGFAAEADESVLEPGGSYVLRSLRPGGPPPATMYVDPDMQEYMRTT